MLEERLKLGNAELFVLRVGEGPEKIVLLHGGPGASHDYLRPQMDQLATLERTLVYYDQRGSGRSSGSVSGGSIDDHVADLEALREKLGVERLALVGYSFGAVLALLYAKAHPQRVAKMALVSPGPVTPAMREQTKARLQQMSARPEVNALRERLDPQNRRHRFALAVAGYFVQPEKSLELTPFLVKQAAEQAVYRSLDGRDLASEVKGLTVDALVVCGVEDPIPIENARLLGQTLGAPLVEIVNCGHVPYVEQPTALFTALEQFLG